MSEAIELYDAGDERQVARAKRRDRNSESARRETLALIMGQPNGRALMHWLLSECHIYESCFHSNSLTMAMREGERNIGLKLVAEMENACPDDIGVMMKEAAIARKNDV